MGLDGISINQLRTPENSSAEISRIARSSVNNEHKTVDGLSQGQKVDPDQGREKDQQLKQGLANNNQDEEEDEIQEEVIKYDLSDNNKYFLKLDEESNNILIIEKSSKNVVQAINADEMSSFVGYMLNSQGSMVNRKF